MQQHYAQGPSLDSTAKILVLGDSGVGKSSLVHALCHNEPLRSSVPTIGCNIDVRLHSSTIPSAAATSTARSTIPSLLSRANNNTADPSAPPVSGSLGLTEPTFIEFYDISGSPAVGHEKSRTMFYRDVPYQGIVLVHDLCNRRSYDNLWKWIGDYLEASGSSSAPRWPSQQQVDALGTHSTSHHGSRYGDLSIPLLVVGTKVDMANSTYDQYKSNLGPSFGQDLVDKYGGEAISVCSISPAEFMPNSSTMIAFNLFFNRIVDPRATPTTASSRSRNQSSNSHYGAHSPAEAPRYPRPPPTPTPGEDPQLQLHHRHPSQPQQQRPGSSLTSSAEEKDEYGSSAIPIMDFATFTGGSSTTHQSSEHAHYHHPFTPSHGPPSRSNSPLDQSGTAVPTARSVTPTGFSSTLSTKSALRAQYERNRSVLGQYNSNMGVPTYTNLSGKGSTSAGGTHR
ncbi:hypothetical protein BGZ72_008399 [Mortierella alpina]|nr:hypothetical protein BGZ72_008399 [Mortierella alpina]